MQLWAFITIFCLLVNFQRKDGKSGFSRGVPFLRLCAEGRIFFKNSFFWDKILTFSTFEANLKNTLFWFRAFTLNLRYPLISLRNQASGAKLGLWMGQRSYFGSSDTSQSFKTSIQSLNFLQRHYTSHWRDNFSIQCR